MTANAIWTDVQAIRAKAPLVHNITNFVVMNNTANALLAIGGISAGNAEDVLKAGAHGIAVVSAICSADDPQGAARTLRKEIEGIINNPGRAVVPEKNSKKFEI
jgi:thiamine monophosphate synthase